MQLNSKRSARCSCAWAVQVLQSAPGCCAWGERAAMRCGAGRRSLRCCCCWDGQRCGGQPRAHGLHAHVLFAAKRLLQLRQSCARYRLGRCDACVRRRSQNLQNCRISLDWIAVEMHAFQPILKGTRDTPHRSAGHWCGRGWRPWHRLLQTQMDFAPALAPRSRSHWLGAVTRLPAAQLASLPRRQAAWGRPLMPVSPLAGTCRPQESRLSQADKLASNPVQRTLRICTRSETCRGCNPMVPSIRHGGVLLVWLDGRYTAG